MKTFALLLSLLIIPHRCELSEKRSIVMIVVDDMRSPSTLSGINLPNYERLARIGFSFENAFAQQSLCAPSRNSFLTGRRPDTLRLYDFYSYWRDVVGNYTTLPQFFKENGYKTFSFGKVFHPGISSNHSDDYPYSWSELPYHPSTERYKNNKTCLNEDDATLASNLVCPVDVEFQPEKTLPDIQIAGAAVEKLKELADDDENPFFVAIGFHKPHIPIKFPKKYLDLYPMSKISLPKMPFRPPTLPTVAWNPWLDVKEREDICNLNISFPYGEMPKDWTSKIIQSYFASLSYIDELIGNVINNINLNNTIIVITSDHGWSLGEHGEWAKYSNFDVALKVPLIISDPKFNKHPHRFKKIDQIVELVDLFPTLAELSGVTDHFPKCPDRNTILCGEGNSLVPIMNDILKENPETVWNNVGYSQYPRPGLLPSVKPNSDKPRLRQIKIMGYTVRTDRFRYTEWTKFNRTSFTPDWDRVYARELYDHSIDDGENLNLADRAQLKYIIDFLAALLRRGNNLLIDKV